MTEQKWMAGTLPNPLINFVSKRVSDRKKRLAAVACCRRFVHLSSSARVAKALDVSERFADQQATQAELRRAQRGAGDVCKRKGVVPKVLGWAAEAAASSIMHGYWLTHCLAQLISAAAWLNIRMAGERRIQCKLIRDIFGNPFRPVFFDPAWRTPTVVVLAQAAYDERILPAGTLDAACLAVLADALEDADCDNADILSHLRGPGPHVRGCWCVDLLLNKV
jgi:hypothetical protein